MKKSLLEGRNLAPLGMVEIQRATNTFIGLDRNVNARYEENSTTRFIASTESNGEEVGEIIFSNDIYPGKSLVSPNAALSLKGAAAHELAHYHRWLNKSELPHGKLVHIDEAMTSLEAALRYAVHLDPSDIHGLITDSLQRLQLYIAENE